MGEVTPTPSYTINVSISELKLKRTDTHLKVLLLFWNWNLKKSLLWCLVKRMEDKTQMLPLLDQHHLSYFRLIQYEILSSAPGANYY